VETAAALKASKHHDAPGLHRKALNNLSAAYLDAGQINEARVVLEAALAAIPPGGPSPERARVLDNLASVLLETNETAKAEKYARQGVAEWKALPQEYEVDRAISMSVLGT